MSDKTSIEKRALDRLRERELAAGLPPDLVTDEWLRRHPHFAYARLGVTLDDLKAAVSSEGAQFGARLRRWLGR